MMAPRSFEIYGCLTNINDEMSRADVRFPAQWRLRVIIFESDMHQ